MVARRSQPESVESVDAATLRDTLAERTWEVEELRQRIMDLEETGGQFLSAAAHATRNPRKVPAVRIPFGSLN